MLSETAQKIFDMKYALTLPSGKKESWEQACVRVAEYVSRAEANKELATQMVADFTKVIYEKSFVPGGRVLANAGTGIKNLMNCFVLPIEDSRQSIYKTLRDAAEIFAWGGGIGYNFSNLRGRGSPVKTTGGLASGPVSFMELFDTTGEVISQASRRGAQMGILNIDHPDILGFINYKHTLNPKNERIMKSIYRIVEKGDFTDYVEKVLADDQLTHFNISVGVWDEYMKGLLNGDYEYLFNTIAESAWNNGDPGLYFIHNANRDNIAPYLGLMLCTNPCGEVPLYPYEACCLGSLNLYNFVEGDFIDFEYLKDVTKLAVRFLDNVQTLNEVPVQEINDATKSTRRLGLGVMGFADVLSEMGFEYDSEDALILAKVLSRAIQYYSWEASMELAEERGAFPEFKASKVNWDTIDTLKLPRKPVRNIAVTSIAPTGTIALLCDVNSGIEPFFSKKYTRNITEGVGNEAKDSVVQEHAVIGKTAHEIHWKDHILMQAEWQNHVDNAVSKTINMPNSATKDDILNAYVMAWQAGCKGITVYRDKSRSFQILEEEENED